MVMIADHHHKPPPSTTAVKLFGQQIGISPVAQPSTEENDDAGGYSTYPDDFKQDAALALAICCLKHSTLDEETSVELEKLKQQLSIRSSGSGSSRGGGGITKPSSSSSSSRRGPRSSTRPSKIRTQKVKKLPKIQPSQTILDQVNSYVGPTQMPAIPGLTGEISSTRPSKIRTQKDKKLPKIQPSQTILDQVSSYVRPTQMPAIPGLTGKMIRERSKPFEKQLTMSDLKDDQSRLNMSKEDVVECIFPMLDKETENPSSGVDVTIYDLSGKSFKMAYKIWADGRTHVLTGGWKDFYRHHGLQKHQDFVTVWLFRRADTGKLCFLLTWRRVPCCVNVEIGRKLLRSLY